MPYQPIKISGFKEGLIQERQDFDLPNDAFLELRNAYLFRESIVKKKGNRSLGRLRRVFNNVTIPGGAVASVWSFNLFTLFSLDGNSPDIELKSVQIQLGAITFSDNGLGELKSSTPGNNGTINYSNGDIALTHTGIVGTATTITYNYFPCLPVMGIKTKEKDSINNEDTVAFDTKFAYILGGQTWSELSSTVPTKWSGDDFNFFWTTNYKIDSESTNFFFATNFVNSPSNDIRYYNGTTWNVFAPVISGTTNLLQSKILILFRGRLIALNTMEGNVLGGGVKMFRNRIRWGAIGNALEADSYNETIRGKGSYLDIPTSQAIVSAGFVRDNLVIFCERSTWQLRYTGNVLQPFQIEKVNTELGVESTFSGIQFDTSIVGIGDKGIVECDSFQSSRIDEKIIDFAYSISNLNNGITRVHGIRDFKNKLAYWIYPDQTSTKFPNKRLVFNYENKSWAVFDDNFTALGVAQSFTSLTWNEDVTWQDANFSWRSSPPLVPEIVGGNQRGFISILDVEVSNSESLAISDIQGKNGTATEIKIFNHNLSNGEILQIDSIPSPSPFSKSLNNKRFSVQVIDENTCSIFTYSDASSDFNQPQIDPASSTYFGGGRVSIVNNFSITTKKFNFIDIARRIKVGYIDLLMGTTANGEITIKILEDYNSIFLNTNRDEFFNTTILTSAIDISDGSSKTMPRVFCNTRGTFLSLNFSLSPKQMNGNAAFSNIKIDAIILWVRAAEKELYMGAI